MKVNSKKQNLYPFISVSIGKLLKNGILKGTVFTNSALLVYNGH